MRCVSTLTRRRSRLLFLLARNADVCAEPTSVRSVTPRDDGFGATRDARSQRTRASSLVRSRRRNRTWNRRTSGMTKPRPACRCPGEERALGVSDATNVDALRGPAIVVQNTHEHRERNHLADRTRQSAQLGIRIWGAPVRAEPVGGLVDPNLNGRGNRSRAQFARATLTTSNCRKLPL
jgi:hypothetical protein